MKYTSDYLIGELFIIFGIQISLSLCILLTAEIESTSEPPPLYLAYSRMAAGILLQLNVTKELSEGMDKMKYVLNHQWKFRSVTQAYLSGFFQATSLIFITLANYYAILVSDNILDVVMNFLSLMVIS